MNDILQNIFRGHTDEMLARSLEAQNELLARADTKQGRVAALKYHRLIREEQARRRAVEADAGLFTSALDGLKETK